MKVKVKSLELSLFKGFKKTQVQFSQGLNLLVGENNSGKSSLLHAIYLAFYFLKSTRGISEIDKKRGISKDRLRGVTIKSMPLPFHDESYLSEGLKKRNRREQSTTISLMTTSSVEFLETITFPGGNLLIISSASDGSAGNNKYAHKVKQIVANDGNSPLFIPTFSGVATKEEVKMEAVVKHYLATGRSSEVLRNQLGKIAKDKYKLRKLNAYLKLSFGVEIVTNDTKEIHLSSLYKDATYDNLDISSAGSGFQQILQILVYIVSAETNIVLIDEPDAHLHYKLQNGLYDIFLEMIKEGKQIIVATHSQIFIRKAIQNADRLLLINRSLDYQKPIDEYSEGLRELYESGLINENDVTQGSSLNLIDIEDVKDGPGFGVLKIWLGILGFREPTYRIVNGGDHIFGYTQTRSKIDNIKLKSLVFRDGDSLEAEYLEKVDAGKSKSGVSSLIHWRSHEIENYLLNEGIIAKLLREKGANGVNASGLRKMIIKIVEDNRDELLDAMDGAYEAKLGRYHKDLNVEYGNIPKLVRNRRKVVRESLVYPFNLLPGKEIFKSLKQTVHQKYGISISEIEVAKSFGIKNVPIELKNAVKFFQV